MRKLLVLFGLATALLSAQEHRLFEQPVPFRSLWKTSITTLAVANALDTHSSWGKRELNPALSGRGGKFGKDGALLKVAFQGGLIGIQYLITRRHPTSGKLYRALSFINFGATAVIGTVTVHNYTIPR